MKLKSISRFATRKVKMMASDNNRERVLVTDPDTFNALAVERFGQIVKEVIICF